MLYHSTRGQSPVLPFKEVILRGLANDGGLYLPQKLPFFTKNDLLSLADANYEKIAATVLTPFLQVNFTKRQIQRIVKESCQAFRHSGKTPIHLAPLHFIDKKNAILELFHGPTYAFKDYALQFLSAALSTTLAEKNRSAFLLGATSGDTGSAAIEACYKIKNAKVIILHPHELVSEKQRRQMTTVGANNIHNFALRGNFDDCQNFVKRIFSDKDFRETLDKKNTSLLAVNSINWGRLVAQTIYYFSTFLQCLNKTLQEKNTATEVDKLFHHGIVVSIPTGNFGNVYSAHLAQRMGLPIGKLIVATNDNDILHRFFSANDYRMETLQTTFSPSMNIMVSSNFERLVFDLLDGDGHQVADLFTHFKQHGKLLLPKKAWKKAKTIFKSYSVNDAQTLTTIQKFYAKHDYLLDPHTAIAQHALESYLAETNDDRYCIVAATAHPVKFDEAIRKANLPLQKSNTNLHQLDELMKKKEAYQIVANNYQTLRTRLLKISNA